VVFNMTKSFKVIIIILRSNFEIHATCAAKVSEFKAIFISCALVCAD
jgi:hypothetical protein